jgi:hypothetical protein
MFKRLGEYLLNLWDALLGRTKRQRNEYFVTSDGIPVQTSAGGSIAVLIVVFLVTMALSFIPAYGAAKLSYCYNTSIGNTESAFIWSLLAFFFCGLYYPYYALLLNPLCSAGGRIGGRR